MKKKVGKKVYDTDNATLVKKNTVGSFGDNAGYEETLYQDDKGSYFLYTNGGAESPYTKEGIIAMGKEKAVAFIAE
ncbi:MAG: hypothetical protein WCR54_04550 [Clostridia bacterium]